MENNTTQNFKEKSIIFKEGDSANQLFIIKSGEVVCLKSSKDRLIPVFVGRANDLIGESAMISDAPYTYSAIALSYVELTSIDTSNFKEVLSLAPEWLTDLTRTMVDRFQSTANLLAENRVLHSSILSEEEFPSSLEVEYKKILTNKIE